MKRLATLLAIIIVLVVSCQALAAGQPSIEARTKPILTIDGLQFKDLNANGKLDPYEDWRLSTDKRIDNLLSLMTLEEKVGLLFHINTGGGFTPAYPFTEKDLEANRTFIYNFNVNHILDNNNGTPDYLAKFHNLLQQMAEGTRLGLPITFSCDRASNTWGGMIDMPHAALGAADDLALAAKLFEALAKEKRAMGYHLTLHPSAVELFRTAFGEDSARVATLITEQVSAYTSNGVQTCLKHFPTNGYGNDRSPAELHDNYGISWKAGFDAGADWIMMTNNRGISYATVQAHYDKPTLDYLREGLGFDGVVLTDWFPVGWGTRPATGITFDGVDIATLTLEQKYKLMLDIGVDQFGGELVMAGLDSSKATRPTNFPDAILNLARSGRVSAARIDESARRVLRTKFKLGLFDDPYVDEQAALRLAASQAYIAKPWAITDRATLNSARNPRTAALDRALQSASTILLINNGVLPLADGTSVCVLGATPADVARDAAGVAKYANVVSDLAKADVSLIRASAVNDALKGLVTNAGKAGVPTIVALDSTSAADYSWLLEQPNVAALLVMTYVARPDHGSAIPGFYVNTEPSVLGDMLFGREEPTGKLPYELPRSAQQGTEDWGDIPFDLGATTAERLQIAAAVRAGMSVPINLGDPLFMYRYGLHYGLKPSFVYSTLVLPKTVKPGERFVISLLLENKGWDGYATVSAYDGASLLGAKFMAVVGGHSRTVEIEAVLTDVGTHRITVGSLSGVVSVAK